MGKWNKLREKILLGHSDANIDFNDLCHLLRRWGFGEESVAAITFSVAMELKKSSIFSLRAG
jgi:hypothetical protein